MDPYSAGIKIAIQLSDKHASSSYALTIMVIKTQSYYHSEKDTPRNDRIHRHTVVC